MSTWNHIFVPQNTAREFPASFKLPTRCFCLFNRGKAQCPVPRSTATHRVVCLMCVACSKEPAKPRNAHLAVNTIGWCYHLKYSMLSEQGSVFLFEMGSTWKQARVTSTLQSAPEPVHGLITVSMWETSHGATRHLLFEPVNSHHIQPKISSLTQFTFNF